MLSEISRVKQVPGEPQKRWFTDECMDLIVWSDDRGDIVGFQLSYDKPHAEKAISWSINQRASHTSVDDGEGRPGYFKGTPILLMDGTLDAWSVCGEFRRRAEKIDQDVVEFVSRRLADLKGNATLCDRL